MGGGRARYGTDRDDIRFEGQQRSEEWQIYIYGDTSMAVKRYVWKSWARGVPSPGIGDVDVDSSPILATKHTIYVVARADLKNNGLICAGLFDKTCTVCPFSRGV